MTVDEIITVNQLLGRIVYFHVLFIEPILCDKPLAAHRWLNTACCRHQPDCENPPALSSMDLIDTPWSVLIDVAASLEVRGCRAEANTCCSPCVVRHTAAAIADTWLGVETTTYSDLAPTTTQHARWCQTIASQLADAFSGEFGAACAHTTSASHSGDGPPSDQFPLVSELTALWRAPIGHVPVTSWLNHCADLSDIAHVLDSRRGHDRTIADRAW